VGQYRGPLLEGCAEEWVFRERQARELAYLAALETLARAMRVAGDPAGAERRLRRPVTEDPLLDDQVECPLRLQRLSRIGMGISYRC
jgi:two-component SAPR family response regulator